MTKILLQKDKSKARKVRDTSIYERARARKVRDTSIYERARARCIEPMGSVGAKHEPWLGPSSEM